MAALTDNTVRLRKNMHLAVRETLPVKTSAVVYEGSLVSFVEATGRAKAAAAAAGETFAGVSLEKKTGNAGGTVSVAFIYGHWEQLAAASALTKAFYGCDVYAADDDSVSTTAVGTAGVRVHVGELVSTIASSKGWIHIRKRGSKTIP